MKFNKVFETGKIRNMELPNRLVVSAMSSHLGNDDGTPNEQVIRYLEAKAEGGWGLVFTEDLGVTEDAGSDPIVGSLWNDAQIPSWKECVSRVHATGGKIGAQIYHAGRERKLDAYESHPVAPSAIKEPAMNYIPRALTVEEIHDLVKAFGQCARRVKECGFDCVEIHGAHGYLVNQFLSPFSNKRTDAYGGTLMNRMRFALEIVEEVRRVVGEDYPIIFRMNICDHVEGGLEVPESIVMAKVLEEAGVDALHCSQGMFASKETIIPPSFISAMKYAEDVATVKASVQIPVIAVGRYIDIHMAETMLRDGKADYIAMARASLADPDLPKKAKEGRADDIIQCIGCDQGCTGETAAGKYPLEALQMMVHIIENTEQHLDYAHLSGNACDHLKSSVSSAIGYSSVVAAANLNAKCIITPTVSGATTRVVSNLRPKQEILGVTPSERVLRRMSIYWGVRPLKSLEHSTTDDICNAAIELASVKQYVETGDIVVLTAGIPSPNVLREKSGASNMMRIATVE